MPAKLSLKLRHQLAAEKGSITFDIDQATNEQFGKQMEGVCANYNGVLGLSTIQVFDELGLQHWYDVRSGNTHTANDSNEIIHRLFSCLPASMANITRYLRADSGYGNKNFFASCMAKNVQSAQCMQKLMYISLINTVDKWQIQDDSDPTNIIVAKGARSCELGETVYRPKNSHLSYRVIIIRALKPDAVNKLLLYEQDYDKGGWVSSIDDSMPAADHIKVYHKTGKRLKLY